MAKAKAKAKKTGVSKITIVQAPRQRSPNYPGIGLRDAVELVGKLVQADGKAGALAEIALKHMGFNVDSGSRRTAFSALKKFGLIDVLGNKIVPTESAITIVRFPDHHPRRKDALRAAALSPTIYKEVLDFYLEQGELPGDDSLMAEIGSDWDFNSNVLPTFVAAFRDTLTYAGLLEGNRLLLEGQSVSGKPDAGEGSQSVKIGDLVQWTVNGSDMFTEPRPVRGLSDDGEYAFVPGTETGLPVSQLTVEIQAMTQTEDKAPPTNPFKDAPAQTRMPPEGVARHHNPPPRALDSSGPSVRFALPRGNYIEIRMKNRVTAEEYAKVKKIFDLAEMAFVEEHPSVAEENPEDFGYDESRGAQ